MPLEIVKAVEADGDAGPSFPEHLLEPCRQSRIRSHRVAWFSCRLWTDKGTTERLSLLDDDELAEAKVAERGAGAHPDRPPHTQLRKVAQDYGGARPAHTRRLDRQLVARLGRPRVAPQSPRVVAHLRLPEQLLRQHQRPAGVADQDRGGGDRGGGAEARRHLPVDPNHPHQATPVPRRGADIGAKRPPPDLLQPSKDLL